MHAILILPMLAWLLSFANWSERRRVAAVIVASAGYLVFAGVVAVTNISGIESPATFALSAIGALVLAGTTVLAVVTAVRQP
jgi:hypothetical protein